MAKPTQSNSPPQTPEIPFPVLLIGGSSVPVKTTGMAAAQGNAGDPASLVQNALRSVLGRSPRASDQVSFLNALTQSFNIEDDHGTTVVRYRPRVVTGDAAFGNGISGKQAAYATSFAATLDRILPLLEDLEPITPDESKVEDIRQIKNAVRISSLALLEELRHEGGLVIPRVRDRISSLSSAIGKLDNLMPSDISSIDSTDADDRYTRIQTFLIGVNELVTLASAQLSSDQKGEFATWTFQVSLQLSAIAENVREFSNSLDEIGFGHLDRATTMVDSNNSIPLESLLEWTLTFAERDAPQLLRETDRHFCSITLSVTSQTLGALFSGFTNDCLPQRFKDMASSIASKVDALKEFLDQGQATPKTCS